jgi:uncharacterized protein YhfF
MIKICKTCGKEKPIFFNTKMIQAILDGRKIMTRRTVKNIPEGTHRVEQIGESLFEAHWGIHGNSMFLDGATEIKCPYQPGDILWVRETWASYCDECESNQGEGYKDATCAYGDCNRYAYKADDDGCPGGKWRPSIHMPKEAARIWLEVTNVRVERLQEITEEDAIKEGISWLDDACYYNNGWHPTFYDPDSGGSPIFKDGFKEFWDSLNTKRGYGWEINPWVWVIEFERMKEDVNT